MNHAEQLQLIDQFEAHYRYDSTYIRELLEYSPDAFAKYLAFRPFNSHRESLSLEVFWIGKIAALQVADCGHCLQLIVRIALEAGVAKELIRATLQGGSKLSESLKDVYDYATCVAAYKLPDPILEARIRQQLSKAQLIELGICVSTVTVFPTIKRALGYTKSCSLIEIEV